MSKADLRAIDEALRSSPNDPRLLLQRGEARRALGQHKEAVADFTATLCFEPDWALAYYGRALCQKALGDTVSAVSDLGEAIKKDPGNCQFLFDRAALKHKQGRLKEAVRDVEASLALQPAFVPALQLRGEVKRKTGDLVKAKEDFDMALKLDPKHVQSLASRGAVKKAIGLRVEALEDFDAALKLAPRSADIFAGRGGVRLELRMAEGAKADFQAALALNPKSDYAKWGLNAAIEQMETNGLQLTLAGFSHPGLNGDFCERRRPGFVVGGYPTFWSRDGLIFLYFCGKEQRWKGGRWTDFQKVQRDGSALGFVAAPVKADIRLAGAENPVAGWHEFVGSAWVGQRQSRIVSVQKLQVNVQTLTLDGFERETANNRFEERYQQEYLVNGYSTYWSSDGQMFLYWSSKEDRWKGTMYTDFSRVRGGANLGVIGAPMGGDITWPDLLKGWFEWCGEKWEYKAKAGVASVGTYSEVLPPPPPRNPVVEPQPRPAKRKAGAATAAPPASKAARSTQASQKASKASLAQAKQAWSSVPVFGEGLDNDWT